MTPEQQKFYDIKHTSDYKVVGEDIDYKVFVDHEKKEVVLQFEESDSREDWKHNLQFLPWPIKLGDKWAWTTRGYAIAYKSTKDQPLYDLINTWWETRAEEKPYKLCIRGWSFGSAMAKIAARRAGIQIDELTTYGDVKCWLNPFYKAKNVLRLREYTTANDFVTWCVPFFHRDKKCQVGPRFSLKEIFHTDRYHQHYEEYDYSKWEEA
jgi:hypothetical protein